MMAFRNNGSPPLPIQWGGLTEESEVGLALADSRKSKPILNHSL